MDLVKVACRVKDSGSKRSALQPLMKCTPTFSPRHDKQMQCNAMIGGPGQAEGETFLKCDHGEDSKGEPREMQFGADSISVSLFPNSIRPQCPSNYYDFNLMSMEMLFYNIVISKLSDNYPVSPAMDDRQMQFNVKIGGGAGTAALRQTS